MSLHFTCVAARVLFILCVGVHGVRAIFSGVSQNTIWLHTVNARPVASVVPRERVSCVAFSHVTEGMGVNVLLAGTVGGAVLMWDTWRLNLMRTIEPVGFSEPIVRWDFGDFWFFVTLDVLYFITVK